VNACPTKMKLHCMVEEKNAAVTAVDCFFLSHDSLFDAMPAMWKNMNKIQRQEECSLIDSLECSTTTNPNGDSLWSIGNVSKVMCIGYVCYDDIHSFGHATL
jgi:hypothetical protein